MTKTATAHAVAPPPEAIEIPVSPAHAPRRVARASSAQRPARNDRAGDAPTSPYRPLPDHVLIWPKVGATAPPLATLPVDGISLETRRNLLAHNLTVGNGRRFPLARLNRRAASAAPRPRDDAPAVRPAPAGDDEPPIGQRTMNIVHGAAFIAGMAFLIGALWYAKALS